MVRGLGSGKTPEKVIQLLQEAVKKSSQSAIARETGIPLAKINRYIRGIGEPQTETLRQLADYFGVSVAELRGEHSSDKPVLLQFVSEVVSRYGVDAVAMRIGLDRAVLEKFASGNVEINDEELLKIFNGLAPGWLFVQEEYKEYSTRCKQLITALKDNEKIIDHLHQISSALVDPWLVENQEKVLKDLTLRQGKIVGELKEMGIDIFADHDWREKKFD